MSDKTRTDARTKRAANQPPPKATVAMALTVFGCCTAIIVMLTVKIALVLFG